ncbi:MAG: hypothetical protein ACKN96_04380 [Actinomycetota bacterium]
MILALNEDGSLPGDPLPFLESFLWFFVAPTAIFLAVWVLVVAFENLKKSKRNRYEDDVITRINE